MSRPADSAGMARPGPAAAGSPPAPPPGTNAAAAMAWARRRLRTAGIDRAEIDARWLLAHCLGVTPERLILHLSQPVPPAPLAAFVAATAARAEGRPVSHILGGRWFYGRWFEVTPEVLDPRPETETLVVEALAAPFETAIDLGTGSGAILLTLLAERPAANGLGIDLSAAALAVARRNAVRLGVTDRARRRRGDWLDGVTDKADLIVANPPYISAAAYAELDPALQRFEPKLALTPGGDGLDAYRAICRAAPARLRPGGRLVVEIGFDQAAPVAALMAEAGLGAPQLRADLDGRPRVLSAATAP
jgi:release factor glutamine methyltransferase